MNYKKAILTVFAFASFNSILVAQVSVGSGQVSGTFRDTQVVQESRDYFVNQTGLGALIVPTASGAGSNQYDWGLYRDLDPLQFFLDQQPVSREELEALGISTFDDAVETLFFPSGNQLSFEGNSFVSQQQGETFVGGTLNFSNETSVSFGSFTTAVDRVGLEFSTDSSDPVFQQLLGLTIGIETTLNSFDADGNILNVPSADFIYFEEHPELGSFRVFEGESTSVEILLEFNSLDLVGFGAVENPAVGFVSSSVGVPEPASMVLLGFFGAGILSRRRRR